MWRSGGGRRGQREALEQLVREATRSGDFLAPWNRQPDIWRHYQDEGEILRVLQRQWSTELSGHMFAAMQEGQGDFAQDVALAFTDAVAHMHGEFRILEANAEHPAIAADRRKEQQLLATAGLPFRRTSAR
ncbi:MAG TPA: hypothetical protein VFK52_12720 [Nocardioidaceae bacterium]|nr:hypothetical protein [Nocardioidaceae bacterium]